jgi:hypothetical protein
MRRSPLPDKEYESANSARLVTLTNAERDRPVLARRLPPPVLPTHVLGDLLLSSPDFFFSRVHRQRIPLKTGEQIQQRLLLSAMGDRQIVELDSHQSIKQNDCIGRPKLQGDAV